MQQQAAVRIDREIGSTDAQMPEPPPPKVSDDPIPENATETVFEPYKPKIRKSGTGCVTMINDHLYEGRFTPRVNGKRISRQDTRGMRGKARRVDKDDESGNCSRKEKGETGIEKGATTNGRPSKFAVQ